MTKLSQRKRKVWVGAGGGPGSCYQAQLSPRSCLSDSTEARGGLWLLWPHGVATLLCVRKRQRRVCPAHRISSAFNSCVHSSLPSLLEVRRRVQAEAGSLSSDCIHVDPSIIPGTPNTLETQQVLYGWA